MERSEEFYGGTLESVRMEAWSRPMGLILSKRSAIFFLAVVAAVFFVLGDARQARAGDPPPRAVDFDRDIRPILADACYKCHGPDAAKRQADLRLDVRAGAFAERGGKPAVVPGDPAQSAMIQRLTATETSKRMPPPEADRKLSPREIDLIERWIEAGAQWQEHWAFIPPQRPPLPPTQNRSWRRSPIDAFILARLEEEGLDPSSEADKATLIRRVTLDLTGLPPAPAEVDAFLLDDAPGAYETVVERLLSSPHYGERMALQWLDLARYADTSGYQTDGVREMWRWRDWVIEAFNRNLPFDQFTVEQLAGDLLPNPSLEQLIATGFNRNHRANSEGGIVPEEYLVEYAVDRVDTTATVWLGLTLGCARCHDHKYDPITQKEFYQALAYFNNLPERGRVIKYGNSAPLVKAPTASMRLELEKLAEEIARAERELVSMEEGAAAKEAEWEAALASQEPLDGSIAEGLLAHYKLDGDASDASDASGNAKHGKFQGGLPASVPGRIGKAAQPDGKCFIQAAEVSFVGPEKFSLGAWILPAETRRGAVLSFNDDDDSTPKGFGLCFKDGKLEVNLGPRWLDDAIRVESSRSLEPSRWRHVMVTYDGSQFASGLKLYVDGALEDTRVLLDEFTGTFTTPQALRIGSQGVSEHFQGGIDDVRYYNYTLPASEVELLACADSLSAIAAMPPGQRSQVEARKLHYFYARDHAPEKIRQAHRRLAELRREKARLEESVPTAMVMEERKDPRPTFVLLRGEYDKPAEKVSPGVPARLAALPKEASKDRLGFAKWLVHPSNPLTSRVTVNRYWQMYFGTGIVKTLEDFGTQGERPSHPELLDWLAVEFIQSGWNIKALQKLMVTSATYRQSPNVNERLLVKDPDNRLLARAPRLRLPAEVIRDQALSASGLLVRALGGPSVKPYQPPGLWKEIASQDYAQDRGENLYRRSLYTFWKRTVPPPSMVTFDAGSRETCTVNRARTNTPLQALALLNEVTYVEAARGLAQRMLLEGGATREARLAFGFRLLTARMPSASEARILLAGLERNLAKYSGDRQAALSLVAAGESKPLPGLDTSELAAYSVLSSLILNLDEVVTKE
jgi:hypothetical protein